MLNFFKSVFKSLPGVRQLVAHRDHLQEQLSQQHTAFDNLKNEFDALEKRQGFVPSGHFYSPVPDFDEINREADRIFADTEKEIPGLDLNEAAQLDLLKQFSAFYQEMPFTSEKKKGLRYHFVNPAYSYSDAIHLHCMIRRLKPRRIIEVGSGFSSCMTLDTNERYFDNSIETTFIEPYPELLHSLLKESDKNQIKLIPTRLQDVDLEIFDALQPDDILFIDSTHVSKVDSDVNRILFEILPRLSEGVYIHFHDIFFPFEYPKSWVLEGRAWTEAYALKAFLQYNKEFSIVMMNTFMQHYHKTFYQQQLPLCLKNTGASIWLKKG